MNEFDRDLVNIFVIWNWSRRWTRWNNFCWTDLEQNTAHIQNVW